MKVFPEASEHILLLQTPVTSDLGEFTVHVTN